MVGDVGVGNDDDDGRCGARALQFKQTMTREAKMVRIARCGSAEKAAAGYGMGNIYIL